MKKFPSRLLLVCLSPIAGLTAAHADEFDVFNLRAGVNVVRDDNLFRTPEGDPRGRQSDTVTSTVAGIDFNKRFSLQEIRANLNWTHINYASHGYLDADAINYDARWLWATGSRLSGELAADRTEVPNSYAEFPELRDIRRRNLRVTENQRFALDFALFPSWHMIGELAHQNITNEQAIFADTDTEATSAGAGVKYTPASGNWASWMAKRYDGKYSKRNLDAARAFDNGYTQTGQEFRANWQFTGRSALNGRMEYIRREHDHFGVRDFSGWNGYLAYLYQYSVKTSFNLAYQRTLGTYQQYPGSPLAFSGLYSYFVGNGVSLGAQWAATEKIQVSARVGYTEREFRGELQPLPAGMPRRLDKTTDGSLDLTYKATRWLELGAGVKAEKRNSNTDGFDFSDRRVMLSANIIF